MAEEFSIEPAGQKTNYGDTVTFGPFPLGVNNVDRSLSMADGEMVSAVNLDISRDGVLTQRQGYSLAVAGTGARSLWARDSTTAFYADATDLKQVTVSAAGVLTSATVRSGVLQLGRHVAYVAVNGDVYYSNGIITGMVRADSTSHSWGVERPSRNPVLTGVAGSLSAGRYLVAIQYINDRGEVGGIPPPGGIVLSAASDIVVSSIPAAVSADVAGVIVYLSKQNGDILYRHSVYSVGTTSVQLSIAADDGAQSADFLFDVMPPTGILEYYNGMIYGAADGVIWHTNALAYGQCARRSNFIMVDSPVTLLKASSDGLFVGTGSRVEFLLGSGPKEFQRRAVTPFGAIPGTGMALPKTESEPHVVGWFSERGFVKGHSGGRVEIGEKERVMLGMYTSGAAFYREQHGVRQVVATMIGGTRAAMTSTDYAEAEVRRNGVLL